MKAITSIALTLALVATIHAQNTMTDESAPTTEKIGFTPMKTGEFWYGMYNPEGNPEGYSRLTVRNANDAKIHCEWELHITYEGGKYEESRESTWTKDASMTYASFESGLNKCFGSRSGETIVGKHGVDDISIDFPTNAVGQMGFVLPAWMPLKEGASVKRPDHNEADGFKKLYDTEFVVIEQEELKLPAGTFTAWKCECRRGNDTTIPVWVSDDRRILQIDWGNGNLMKLHDSPTLDLFKPKPPTLEQLEPENKRTLKLTTDLALTPEIAFDWFTKPDLLTNWWPPKAEIEPKVGGKYILKWEAQEWTLRGEIKAFERGKKFSFTWKWDHEPDASTLTVTITFKKTDSGSNMVIEHGPFNPINDDQLNRESLHQGWEFFITALKAKIKVKTADEDKKD